MPRSPGSPTAKDPDPTTDDWVCIHIDDEAKAEKATNTGTDPDDIRKSLQAMRQGELIGARERKASEEYMQAEAVADQEIERAVMLLHDILPPQPDEDHDHDSDDNFSLEMPLATSPTNRTTPSSPTPSSPHFSYQPPADSHDLADAPTPPIAGAASSPSAASHFSPKPTTHSHDLADLPRSPVVNAGHGLTVSSPSTPYRRFSSKPPTADGNDAIRLSIQPTAVNRLSTLSHHSSSQLAMKPPPKCSDLFFKAAVGVTVTAAVVAIAKSLG
ncbi:hypothetical protein ACR9PT_11845 [Piscirickettsia salmonis]|uniref:hypothetical protein n=1 Tax=Piscirickettsia salmonis TaxID=1238 RepID=UPI003EC033E1